jgi:hypothetical protein
MRTTVAAAGDAVCPPLAHVEADTLRAVAEAAIEHPASAGLVARLNPGHPRERTLSALEQLHQAGLVAESAHPLTPLLSTYALSPAGRRWVRRHG